MNRFAREFAIGFCERVIAVAPRVIRAFCGFFAGLLYYRYYGAAEAPAALAVAAFTVALLELWCT
jgi:hypothetical protein